LQISNIEASIDYPKNPKPRIKYSGWSYIRSRGGCDRVHQFEIRLLKVSVTSKNIRLVKGMVHTKQAKLI
jgi:hypothetical protein